MHVQSQKIRMQRSRQLAMTNINIAASASTAQSSPDHGGADQPEELIWNTLIQLSSALAYCHYGIPYTESLMEAALGQADSKGVCHRDLTPSNGKNANT